jgi:hypothetical protein
MTKSNIFTRVGIQLCIELQIFTVSRMLGNIQVTDLLFFINSESGKNSAEELVV